LAPTIPPRNPAPDGSPSLEWKLAQPCRAGKDPLTFTAQLWAPMEGKGWTFATVPAATTKALGDDGRVDVQMTVGGKAFPTTLYPIAEGRHIVQVSAAVRAAAQAAAGDDVTFILTRRGTKAKAR
jgi:hypothetical protein